MFAGNGLLFAKEIIFRGDFKSLEFAAQCIEMVNFVHFLNEDTGRIVAVFRFRLVFVFDNPGATPAEGFLIVEIFFLAIHDDTIGRQRTVVGALVQFDQFS